MAFGGNACGGLQAGMRSQKAVQQRPQCGCHTPWLPGVTAWDRTLQPQTHYAWFGVHMSEYFSVCWRTPTLFRHPSSSGTVRNRGGCVQVRAQVSDKHIQIRDRKRKIRSEIECDIESSDLAESRVAAALFTFRRRWRWSKAQQANAGWQLSEAGPPGLSVGRPSCHLSNDFFILQEELVARGNAPLPAWGNPTLGQADAGTRYVCSHITRDQHILSSCLCFFAFFFPLSTQSSV